MTDKITLDAEVRQELGSKAASKLRKAGKMPVVVYGHGKDSVSIAISHHEFEKGLQHGQRLFEAKIDGKSESLLVKALQYDHLGKDVIHADLIRVDLSEKVTVTVSIEGKGTAKGSQEGGVIDWKLSNVEVECMVSDIPEGIVLSLKDIEIGDSIHAKDIELPSGSVLVTDADALVLTCHVVAEAKTTEELEAEMPEGPEVITEKPEEEGEEA
jgi:large subunit ribosomal protein L25